MTSEDDTRTRDRNVFVSHVHEDDKGVKAFKDLVKTQGMTVKDYSVTKDKPNAAKSDEYIKYDVLKPKIEACSVLVVYVTPKTKDSKWVDFEVRCADRLGKRVVGVWAHGHAECELPESLKELADTMVAWNSENVAAALNGEFNEREDRDGKPCSKQKTVRVKCQ